jgi:hypothetical protein
MIEDNGKAHTTVIQIDVLMRKTTGYLEGSLYKQLLRTKATRSSHKSHLLPLQNPTLSKSSTE